MIFIETPIFTEDLAGLLSDDGYGEFQQYLADNPEAGDVIPDTGGMRKIRWGANGKGKRGGVRVIYFHVAVADSSGADLPKRHFRRSNPGPKEVAQKRDERVAIMDKDLFNRLAESMTQMDEIARGERQPSREFHVDAAQVKSIRKATGLPQSAFAKAIGVAIGTLQNWEQGRRDPEGPAKALLRAIHNDPKNVIAALKQ